MIYPEKFTLIFPAFSWLAFGRKKGGSCPAWHLEAPFSGTVLMGMGYKCFATSPHPVGYFQCSASLVELKLGDLCQPKTETVLPNSHLWIVLCL